MSDGRGHFVTAAITAASSCLASAAITTVVAIAAPAETGDALFASVVVAAIGLWRARQIADPDEYDDDYDDYDDDEPSVAQDPTQRRIDEVLEMVRYEKVTPVEGERLIATLRAHPLPADAPAYGTPEGS